MVQLVKGTVTGAGRSNSDTVDDSDDVLRGGRGVSFGY